MRALAKILVDPIKANKAYFLFLLALVVGCSFYAVFRHSQITAMYEGRSFNFLNNLIQYQHKHSLEHYLELADKLFLQMLFLLFSLGSFVYLLYLLVFSARKVSLYWPVLFFTFVLIMVYLLNSNHRVYSYHGFYRMGIAYQILNGSIPPPDHLFAGEPLLSPWGFPFLAACITLIFHISPFYACALLNIFSLILVTYLIYKISQLLIPVQRANVLSAIISIFGVSIIPPFLLSRLTEFFGFFFELRVAPAYGKFFNLNGVPVGLVFFFLSMYSILRILASQRIGLHSFLLFFAVVVCGFIYPPMLPGMIAGIGAVCVLLPVLRKYNRVTFDTRKIFLIAGISLLGLLLLIPYWLTISAGVKGGLQIANPRNMIHNLFNYIFLSLPILIVIFLHRKHIVSRLNPQPLIIVATITAATTLSYLLIRLPGYAEYKFLLLSFATLGIFGGISFHFMRQQRNKLVVFLLMLLFFVPCAEAVHRSLTRIADIPITYAEKGRYIHSLDPEEEELYAWIRQNTPTDSVFVDTELTIPVYAQRRLFIGVEKKGKWGALGYYIRIDYILHFRHGYPMDAIEKRSRIVKEIYTASGTASETEMKELFDEFEPVYIVTRDYTILPKFEFIVFEEQFRSLDGKYRVYQKRNDNP